MRQAACNHIKMTSPTLLPQSLTSETQPLVAPPCKALPGRSTRWAASVLLVAYFFAVFAALTGAGSGRFSPPLVSAEASAWVRPVLQPLNLDNSHRYYAPNPGAESTLWLRLLYADSTVRWLEWPSRDGASSAYSHTRSLLVPGALSSREENPAADGEVTLTPHARVLIASFARHIALRHQRTRAGGGVNEVVSMQFYLIDHAQLTPPQVRAGMKFSDLRLLKLTSLGSYNSTGQELGRTIPHTIAAPELVARMLNSELLPAVRAAAGATQLDTTAEEVGIPLPVRKLLGRQPSLATSNSEVTPEAIRAAVFSNDHPDTPLKAGDDFGSEWILERE